MSVPVLNPEGLPTGQATFAGRVAEQEIKPHLIHETVVAELGARRAGTHSTKTRAEVRGGGKKPWRQKGTGRARQGSIRAPHWTGGGVVFGPTPRSHGGKVNRKVRVQAFRSALRAHAERGSVALMEPTGWDSPSTKRAADYLYQAPDGLADRALLVILEDPESVEGMSFRNLSDVYVLAAIDVEVVDLMAARSLLVQRSVWEHWIGSELEVASAEATAKAAPERTAPPKPKPLAKKKDTEAKPKRADKKAAAAAPAEDAVEETAEELETPAVEVDETVAEETVATEATDETAVETADEGEEKS
jgi:large subunit ribosomal protein L4